MKHTRVLVGAVVVLGAVAWYAFRPERLFVNTTVNESLASASQTESAGAMMTDAAAAATASVPSAISSGRFHGNAHQTTGVASIYDLGGGRRVLRLTNFMTSNGPDVRVYLVAASDVQDNETVKSAGFVELGPMKGNQGDQNYDIPADVDLSKYRTVTIWCKRFSVNFGSAPLAAS